MIEVIMCFFAVFAAGAGIFIGYVVNKLDNAKKESTPEKYVVCIKSDCSELLGN